jgi:hypothetical protein
MSEREDPRLEPRDRELVDWIGRHYAPPEETTARRAAFTESLRARLEPRRGRVFGPAFAALAAACLAWWLLPGAAPEDPATVADVGAWEYELLLSSDVSPAADRDESGFLPDDYQAIATVFLGS